MDSPYWHCRASFDAVATVRRHEAVGRQPRPGYVVNYFGATIDPMVLPQLLPPIAGTVEADALPANWHADLAEFAACMRAIDLAGERFTMIELGCGWGCWMTITGVAARRSDRQVRLIGVEGDPHHLGLARGMMALNGFSEDEHVLHHGIAASAEGTALFPRQEGGHWGLAPLFGADDTTRDAAVAAGSHEALPMVSLARALESEARIDLLHSDVQGGERALIPECLPLLNDKVAYMMIGTHGREVEGELHLLLLGAGWLLEMDRPCWYHMEGGTPVLALDGVQGWRNPRLLPPA